MKRPKKDYRVYLHDILSAIGRVEEYAKKGRSVYLEDGLLQDGIIRQISIVGEAVSKLPKTWTAKHPDIPWRAIIAMRNILIHDYSDINPERVWTVAKADLPLLKKTIAAMLSELAA